MPAHRPHLLALATTALLAAAAPAPAALLGPNWVFFSDFDHGPPPEVTGETTLAPVEGLTGLGPAGGTFAGQFLHNQSGFDTGDRPPRSTRLNLTGLPQHNAVDLKFLLGILNTWDAERLTVRVDGNPVFADAFAFFEIPLPNTPLYAAPPGVLLTPPVPEPCVPGTLPGRPIYPDLGFANSWGDQA